VHLNSLQCQVFVQFCGVLSNVEKQDENNISASAKTQDNNQQRIKIKTLEVRNNFGL
jgi:hypothetical protein